MKIWGFDQTGDVFLDIDTAAVKGLDITVRGNHTEIGENFPSDVNDTTVAQYVEIPAGWDSTNSIRFVNEANGDTHTLTTGQAY